ncbi:DUF742 domain-containing protein, partial [Streptomyces sp. NPDC057540]
MGTPPGASPYNGYGAHQAPLGDAAQNRFNFPSTPSRQGVSQPYAQPQVPSAAGSPSSSRGPSSSGGSGGHNPLVRPYAMTGGRTR